MKRIFGFLVFLVMISPLIPMTVNAQTEPYSPLEVGISAGYNFDFEPAQLLNLVPATSISTSLGPYMVPNTFSGGALNLGVSVHILPALSVRPTVVVATEWTTLEAGTSTPPARPTLTKQSSWGGTLIGGKVDVLWHFLRFPIGSIYLGPSVGYLTSYGEMDNEVLSAKAADVSETDFQVGAIIGGQVQVFKGFGIYMETGVTYAWLENTAKTYDTTSGPTFGDVNGEARTDSNEFYFNGLTVGFVAYFN